MAISPIMGLSSYSAISSVQPMNYTVENDADFSDVYNTDSVKGGDAVTGTSPVQYPNAKITDDSLEMTIDPLEKQRKTIQVSSDFNNIAMKFASNTNTGYELSGAAASYTTAGSMFDAYA